MADTGDIDLYKAVLRARGVPERFIDGLAARRKASGERFLNAALLFILIVIPVACLLFWEKQTPALAPLLWPGAQNSLLFSGPSLIDVIPALLVIVFVLGFVVPVLLSLPFRRVRPSPAYNETAKTLRTLLPWQNLEELEPDPAYQGLAHLADDRAFLVALQPPRKPIWRIVVALLIFLGMFSALLWGGLEQVTSYRIVTDDAVRIHSLTSDTVYPLSRVTYARVVCTSTGGFDYVLHYPATGQRKNDTTFSLWREKDTLHRLNADQVLDRINRIDTRLAQLHVPIERMPADGSVHDDALICIRATVWSLGLRDDRGLRHLVLGE